MNKYSFLRIYTLLLTFCLSLLAVSVANADEPPPYSSRNVTFVNQCPFPVWFAFVSGAAPLVDTKQPCTVNPVNSGCVSGATCVQNTPNSTQCFWKNPQPANVNYELAANGGTANVSVPVYTQNYSDKTLLDETWSGLMLGRTGCAPGQPCATGDCSNGPGGCSPSKGAMPPATQGEMTFNNETSDYYDVEMVNGFNIPVVIAPDTNQLKAAKKAGDNNDPFNCGSPGATQPTNGAPACSWQFTPPANDYIQVSYNANAACETNAQCTDPNVGTVCGSSVIPGTSTMQKNCGKFLGYWSADQYCSGDTANTNTPPFNCAQDLPAPNVGLKLYDLYRCDTGKSCYSNGADNSCCGCAEWSTVLGIQVPETAVCKPEVVNPNWEANVQPKIQWTKQACPTAYTYPFDDPTSTFQCQIPDQNNINSTNYTVTFCPGGATGAPSDMH